MAANLLPQRGDLMAINSGQRTSTSIKRRRPAPVNHAEVQRIKDRQELVLERFKQTLEAKTNG